MSIIGIDIGCSTTKIIEYRNKEMMNKTILRKKYEESDLQQFINQNNIKHINKIVFTGMGAKKIEPSNYNYTIEKIEEFDAIGKFGQSLISKDKLIVISIGTGTSIVEVNNENIRHLGGTGVGAGTLFNLCKNFFNIDTFDKILEITKKGNLEKIDLRICDVTNEIIETLPKDLTLANFGKFERDAQKEDIVLGFVNMIFEVIGIIVSFACINSKIDDVIVIGNITVIPIVKEILKKFQLLYNINFIIPENTEYGVALGAIISSLENKD